MTKITRYGLGAVVLVAMVTASGQTELDECFQKQSAIYLDTLRVTNCLRNAQPVDGRVVTRGVTQRIENVGKQEVIVEIYDSYFKGPIATVIGEEGAISRTEVPPDLHRQKYLAPILQQYPLKPGDSVTFKVDLQDVVEREARAGATYTVFMTTSVPFRQSSEPAGQAFLLRRAEANRRGSFSPRSMFENVVLR